jgi:hypothetical protein
MQLYHNILFAIIMQLPYDYNHNVMLMPSKLIIKITIR